MGWWAEWAKPVLLPANGSFSSSECIVKGSGTVDFSASECIVKGSGTVDTVDTVELASESE
jgi:hypothetical protein